MSLRKEPYLRWQGIRITACVLVVLFITSSCAKRQSQYDMLASRFTVAAEKLETQRTRTLEALQVASEAQVIAVTQEEFDFKSEETLAFVLRWETAGAEVSQLRRDVQVTVSSCYEMLDGLRLRAEAINDQEIRTRTVNYVDQRMAEFETAVGQTESAITTMENAMRLGNDIIESLRIVGTANLVRQKIGELETKQQEAISSFPDVDSIIQEGRKFLNIEFGEELFI